MVFATSNPVGTSSTKVAKAGTFDGVTVICCTAEGLVPHLIKGVNELEKLSDCPKLKLANRRNPKNKNNTVNEFLLCPKLDRLCSFMVVSDLKIGVNNNGLETINIVSNIK